MDKNEKYDFVPFTDGWKVERKSDGEAICRIYHQGQFSPAEVQNYATLFASANDLRNALTELVHPTSKRTEVRARRRAKELLEYLDRRI